MVSVFYWTLITNHFILLMFSKAKKGAGLLFGLALVLLGGVLSSNSLYAQSRITVSGTVTDGTGYPVISEFFNFVYL